MKDNCKNYSRSPAEQEAYLMMEWITTSAQDILDENKFDDEVPIIYMDTELKLGILERIYALEMLKAGYSAKQVRDIMETGDWVYGVEEDPAPELENDYQRFR